MALFADSDQQSADEIFRHVRKALEGYFANNKCAEPEDCAGETLRRAVEAAEHEDIAHPYAFIWNTARLVLFEAIRRSRKIRREVPIAEASVAAPDDTERIILLREVLATLEPREAALLRKSFLKDRSALAKEEGITVQQLNFKLYTIKNKLRDKLRKPRP
jgi:DNA-directed RNA polymerase specialized sigma24 family protein